jgi:TrmH family RNA methyltransferase
VPRQVTAFSNPLVKQARSLRDKKNRRAEGLFLAEGLRILTEARETGRLPERLFFSDGSHPLLAALIEATEAAGGEAIETSQDIIHKISGKDNPQAVIGIYKAFDTALAGIDRDAAPLWIVAQARPAPAA